MRHDLCQAINIWRKTELGWIAYPVTCPAGDSDLVISSKLVPGRLLCYLLQQLESLVRRNIGILNPVDELCEVLLQSDESGCSGRVTCTNGINHANADERRSRRSGYYSIGGVEDVEVVCRFVAADGTERRVDVGQN